MNSAIVKSPPHTVLKESGMEPPFYAIVNAGEGRLHFPRQWEPMPKEELVKRVALQRLSHEYLLASKRLPQNFTVQGVERVQNPYLWEMYQNRRDLFLKQNDRDLKRLNEKYLWHGTSRENLDNICERNLDWRRHGINVGQIYGQGTYFTDDPLLAARYAQSSPSHRNEKCMLLMRVLVGKCALGNGSMTMPPDGYETTADNVLSPKIFVKYHDQDYYPEYAMVKSPPHTVLKESGMEPPFYAIVNAGEGRLHFPRQWEPMPKEELVKRVALQRLSHEYLLASKRLPQNFTVQGVERVQNPYLWEMYQNRRDLFLKQHDRDLKRLNEKYLWHGTSRENLDNICERNLDWRRHGINVGQIYGQGTYFTDDPLLAARYAQSSPSHRNEKCMLLMRVLVGKCALGNGSMTMPPDGYETTADNVLSPKIFVKYHDQDYYPEYVLYFTVQQ
ncbi:unnamed protein product [Darwinula stevensoni]|uniref:Poly [ADP-ribose] polymerase n=1 Tax=Darwinula stevensoni TaxID=69355 RepID=A0A7R9AEF9_9CRUS|nr:unnamed protein product [Darwinula stevensoni]CAG0901880.1 unnamed protein product [Darwinula stevensoni]